MPLLLEAMGELAKQKPENAIEFVAQYLLKNNPERLSAKELKWWVIFLIKFEFFFIRLLLTIFSITKRDLSKLYVWIDAIIAVVFFCWFFTIKHVF